MHYSLTRVCENVHFNTVTNSESYNRVDVFVDRWFCAHTLHPGCKAERGELQNTQNTAEVSLG